MENKDIPHVFYLYLHSKLFNAFKGEPHSVQDVKSYMFQWKIPRKLRPLVLKELELLGLLKINRVKVEFERPKFNEKEYNKYYHKLGLF